MSQVQAEHENYRMPPQDGFTVAPFLVVADIERSARFYERVFGGRTLSKGDGSGAPGYIQIANTWLSGNQGDWVDRNNKFSEDCSTFDNNKYLSNCLGYRYPDFMLELH